MFQYSVILQWSNEDEGYIARVPELPGVSAFGETPEDAIKEVKVSAQLCIETMQDDRESIPEPRKLHQHSGQLRIRIPKSLHARLALHAEEEGVSLNTYIIHLLSENTGREAYKKLNIDSEVARLPLSVVHEPQKKTKASKKKSQKK